MTMQRLQPPTRSAFYNSFNWQPGRNGLAIYVQLASVISKALEKAVYSPQMAVMPGMAEGPLPNTLVVHFRRTPLFDSVPPAVFAPVQHLIRHIDQEFRRFVL